MLELCKEDEPETSMLSRHNWPSARTKVPVGPLSCTSRNVAIFYWAACQKLLLDHCILDRAWRCLGHFQGVLGGVRDHLVPCMAFILLYSWLFLL